MAIPFYEDDNVDTTTTASLEASTEITDGDQVDGPAVAIFQPSSYDEVDFEGPPTQATPPTPSTTSNTNTSTGIGSGTGATSEVPATTEEQLLAWKMLALTMCKVLKQFYLQQIQQQQQDQQQQTGNGKPSKLIATVHIQPPQAQ
ncbi:uncharacterized protein Dwil_GK11549 [Drosophila willistoni]|uniref:Uncharacterized protein n=1 Tax=Drosophila willistoni TaxID=7260 RepID=B4N452_DROWI|nr:uncharacterized protein LOC6645572 [Drosophila willistoni]EDW78926.1 uncharacterized protein Dwil_GK11549 [Drosophila willistoni]